MTDNNDIITAFALYHKLMIKSKTNDIYERINTRYFNNSKLDRWKN